MNRCARRPLGARGLGALVALASAFALTSPAALAQNRNFPEQAMRGLLVVVNPPDITLNGKAERLSPGSRLRNANNLIVFPQDLRGQQLVVNYTREATGLVHDIWVLTPTEAAQPRAGASDMVIRNYRSGTEPGASNPTTR
jgi:hypothetical protein